MTAPVLITGGSGQIGGALARLSAARGIAYAAPDRATLDLTRPDSVRATLRSQPWSCVVNCAAYVAVDRAEAETGLAMAINRDGAGLIAAEAAAAGTPIIQLSTDYVFDGTKPTPYVESDPVAPINAYGRSKQAGEAAVRAANPDHVILRTAWVVSAGRANFLDTMLRLGAQRDRIAVVTDQIGCPTGADDIAAAILAIVDQRCWQGLTLHMVNRGDASWFDLAAHIFARVAQAGGRVPRLDGIGTADYPTPAARPANSRLDTALLRDRFGYAPRPWQAAVDAILDQRLNGAAAP